MHFYSEDYLHPRFVLRVAFTIFVSTCFFIIDYLHCDGCVTSILQHEFSYTFSGTWPKKGGGATGRSPFALMSYFQPIDHYLWVGEITVLWLRKDFPIPLTLEAWTFGDCEASCAIVKCHDYGWGPSLSCLTLLIPSLSSCLLPEHFVLGGL